MLHQYQGIFITFNGLIAYYQVDIPMVPGVGLYLNELFFDTYTNKLKFEEQKAQVHKQEAETSPADKADDTSCAVCKQCYALLLMLCSQ